MGVRVKTSAVREALNFWLLASPRLRLLGEFQDTACLERAMPAARATAHCQRATTQRTLASWASKATIEIVVE